MEDTSSSPAKISSSSWTPRATSLSYKAFVADEKSSWVVDAKREALEAGTSGSFGAEERVRLSDWACRIGTYLILSTRWRSAA